MDPQKLSLAITKALAYTENGGKPSISGEKAGKSGELKSIFQFEPATWKAYSKEVTGKDDVPLTPETEAYVVNDKVNQWVTQGLAKGKSPTQIALEIGSEWNAGNPEAYKENVKGTNKEGVSYDTPKYAQEVAKYTNQFISGGDQNPEQDPNMQKLIAISNQAKQSTPQPQNNGLAGQKINGGANFGALAQNNLQQTS